MITDLEVRREEASLLESTFWISCESSFLVPTEDSGLFLFISGEVMLPPQGGAHPHTCLMPAGPIPSFAVKSLILGVKSRAAGFYLQRPPVSRPRVLDTVASPQAEIHCIPSPGIIKGLSMWDGNPGDHLRLVHCPQLEE